MREIEIGIDRVCPTDCTLYIKEGSLRRVLLIESDGWRAAGIIKEIGPLSVTINEKDDRFPIAEAILRGKIRGD